VKTGNYSIRTLQGVSVAGFHRGTKSEHFKYYDLFFEAKIGFISIDNLILGVPK